MSVTIVRSFGLSTRRCIECPACKSTLEYTPEPVQTVNDPLWWLWFSVVAPPQQFKLCSCGAEVHLG